jgi:hypothetical protein
VPKKANEGGWGYRKETPRVMVGYPIRAVNDALSPM